MSVRTVTRDGESDDPTELLNLNPGIVCCYTVPSFPVHLYFAFIFAEFPEAPSELDLQQISDNEPLLLYLHFTLPSNIQQFSTDLTYRVFLNHTHLVKAVPLSQLSKAASSTDECRMFVELRTQDFAHLSSVVSTRVPCSLTVRACDDYYTSTHSQPVALSSSVMPMLFPWLIKQFNEGALDENTISGINKSLDENLPNGKITEEDESENGNNDQEEEVNNAVLTKGSLVNKCLNVIHTTVLCMCAWYQYIVLS